MALWIWILSPPLLVLFAWLQRANGRSRLPVRLRAPLDTTLHGLVPAVAFLPLAAPAGGALSPLPPLLAFAVGFALDLDHPVFFRSLSIETCSSGSIRPPLHSLAPVLLGGVVAALVLHDWIAGVVVGSSALAHVLFDATDGSGVPWFFPAKGILRDLPYWAYALFLALLLALAEGLAIAGRA